MAMVRKVKSRCDLLAMLSTVGFEGRHGSQEHYEALRLMLEIVYRNGDSRDCDSDGGVDSGSESE